MSQGGLLSPSSLAQALRTQRTIQLEEFGFSPSLFFLPFALYAKLLGSCSCLCPQGSSKGPILSRRSDGGNSINGKQDGWHPGAQSVRGELRWAPPGGGGREKCCRNTPSLGALLGLERAAALAKTCFCQQKPHFTNIQQHKNRKWQENPEDYAPLLQASQAASCHAGLKSLASLIPALNKWAPMPAHHFVNTEHGCFFAV